MTYQDFLNAVIDDGQDEVRRTYLQPDRQLHREGCLAGFEACRGKTPEELVQLRLAADATALEKMRDQAGDYWYHACYRMQVDWTVNVVSALHYLAPPTHRTQLPRLTSFVSARAARKAADILGDRTALSEV